jgi:hypothetical protein
MVHWLRAIAACVLYSQRARANGDAPSGGITPAFSVDDDDESDDVSEVLVTVSAPHVCRRAGHLVSPRASVAMCSRLCSAAWGVVGVPWW